MRHWHTLAHVHTWFPTQLQHCKSACSTAVALPVGKQTGMLSMQEERNAQELLDEEDKPDYTPQAFDSLRQVPMYSDFIKERFERCLDLYLCPRGKKNRINVDPQTLVPKLPKPQDLQPFPTTLLLRYTGHTGRVSFQPVALRVIRMYMTALIQLVVCSMTLVPIRIGLSAVTKSLALSKAMSAPVLIINTTSENYDRQYSR